MESLIARLLSRRPMSWAVALWDWLCIPFRRRQERRLRARVAEDLALAATLTAAGKHDTARVLRRHAERLERDLKARV